jgi:hypothetical protein
MQCFRLILLALLCSACSSGSNSELPPAADGSSIDAPTPTIDAPQPMIDAPPIEELAEGAPSSNQDGGEQGADAATSDVSEDAPEAAVCDHHFPPCPSPPPSYTQDIVPVVKFECVGCHYPNNSITRTSYTTYQGVYSDRGSILNEIYACNMPPAPYPPLTTDQRTMLLQWLECGAPNN